MLLYQEWKNGQGKKEWSNWLVLLDFLTKIHRVSRSKDLNILNSSLSATNSPYIPQMLESEGYEKKVDLVNYQVRIPEELPVIYKKVLSRVSNNKEL